MSHVLNRITASLGTAITGTILVAVYRIRLDSAALPTAVAHDAHRSVYQGLASAQTNGNPALTGPIRMAFADGMSAVLLTSAGIALLGAVAALVLLGRPRRT